MTSTTPLIDRISNPQETYFNIFSAVSKLELVDLTCSTPLLASLSKHSVILTELRRWNTEFNSYYGQLETEGLETVNITVKIGSYYSIANEALQYRYRRIHSLQGKTVLVCHGIYGLVSRRKQLGVLILERFGIEVEDYFVKMSRVEKTALLNQLLELHSLGIILKGLVPNNVLESDFCSGDLRLIDFAEDNIESNHRCRRAAHPENKTFRFTAETAKTGGGWDYPAVCPDILSVAQNMHFWDHGRYQALSRWCLLPFPLISPGRVLYLGFHFKVDDVPSARLMQRLKPVNWMRVFALDVQETLYRDWFCYMLQEIQKHGLKETLDTALEKLDAWEKVHLPRYPREREWMYPNLKGATPYAHAAGLVSIPYKAS
ncbi:hypothetical protein CYLTODRAFT_442240 [Cylindrobasidium torrendii FP15055 ss-10]|uniref:Uncharacterized protein n=1 Tax=Cylindrobasidium torrendii FP15055 ss-10 TaxID=1314674 RepID=A0A0D7BIV9_9AGAR|nr:hypothetical protein CYLTODRAFT_442240 [Cylindrobasidium torrendii FP15055 ss-10]